MPLPAGATLGPYEILAPLGAGGMGEVYRALDRRLSREVAVKVLPDGLASDQERRARFEREARAAGCLNHPNLLVVYDVGWDAATPFLVTELLRGQTLGERLIQGPLPLRAALDIALQVAAGLAAAHRQGVVHRDLKPANLFLDEDGRIKILDFGLAQVASSDSLPEAPTLLKATSPGMVLGTVPYMAPEQVRGELVDARCDVFAFGIICFEMLSGTNPFARGSTAETMSAILYDDARPVERLSAVPLPLRHFLNRCLAKSRDERPASGEALVAGLQGTETAKPRGRRRAIESLAVLPFVAEGVPEDVEYLADGITEGLIHALSRLPRLRVMARSTVFRFKGASVDPRAVGAELGVAAVLSGRVACRRDQLLVNAELVNVADGVLLWDERLSRPLAQLVDTEEEIAVQLAGRLRPKLSPTTRRSAPRPTRDSAAYQAYLRGRFLWNRWTTEGLRASIGHYEEALAIDPRFGMAHAGLADSWAVLGNIKAVAPAEAYPRAKAAALAALAIDDQLAAAHASLGYVRWLFDWDWPGAEASFRRAIDSDGEYATGRRWYGQFLCSCGRSEEALREVRRALELEPLSLVIHTAVGDVLFYARRYAEAVPYYRRAIELDAAFLAGHSDLARALEHCGRLEEAISEYQVALRLGGSSAPDPSVGLATVYALSGRREEAGQLLEELHSLRGSRYISPWGLASVNAVLGEEDTALDWLERAYTEHDSTLVWIKVHPRFDRLRARPEFQALVLRMGLAA